MPCRHECECPSQLHHDLQTLLASIDAPIPAPSRAFIISELRSILERDEETAT